MGQLNPFLNFTPYNIHFNTCSILALMRRLVFSDYAAKILHEFPISPYVQHVATISSSFTLSDYLMMIITSYEASPRNSLSLSFSVVDQILQTAILSSGRIKLNSLKPHESNNTISGELQPITAFQ
jgi:hypothetical protein